MLRGGLSEEEEGFSSEECEMIQILIAKRFHFAIYCFLSPCFFSPAQLIAHNMEMLVRCGRKP